MKKILIIILSILIACNSFAEELWNGFTDEMTIEQVLSKGNKLFGCNGQNYTEQFTPEYKWLDNGPCHWRDDSARFPTPEYVIAYRSKQTQYSQDFIYGRGNIEFYFYKGKYLLSLCVHKKVFDFLLKVFYKALFEAYNNIKPEKRLNICDSYF